MAKPRHTRKRSQLLGSFYGETISESPSGAISVDRTKVPVLGSQETTSEGHQWPPPKGSNGNFGGDFRTQKVLRSSKFTRFVNLRPKVYGSYPHMSYSGHLAATHPMIQVPPSGETSDAELIKLGAQAIERCAPGNFPAQLLVTLGELYREGLPHLVGSQTWMNRSAGALESVRHGSGDYLNLQFGWRPLVSDIRKLATTVVTFDQMLLQFERDAGRNVRRTYRFPLKTDTEETTVASGTPPYGYLGSPTGPFGVIKRRRTVSREIWFSGCFTYHIPSGYDSRWRVGRIARKAELLLGTDITPEALWNLTPWSWAVDWFTNTGSVLKNIQLFSGPNGLIMRYGYIMETSVVTDTYSNEGTGLFGQPLGVSNVWVNVTTKKRLTANPFGFGVLWSGLSPFQLSIMAALGITRSGR